MHGRTTLGSVGLVAVLLLATALPAGPVVAERGAGDDEADATPTPDPANPTVTPAPVLNPTVTPIPTETPTPDPVLNPTVTPTPAGTPAPDDATQAAPPTATPTPASGPDTVVTGVTVNQSLVAPGEPVAIVAMVENRRPEPTRTTVGLRLFGETVGVRTVSVPAADTRTVTFVRSVEASGEYYPSVAGIGATFRVGGDSSTPTVTVATSGDTTGFSGVAVLVGTVLVGAALLLWRRL